MVCHKYYNDTTCKSRHSWFNSLKQLFSNVTIMWNRSFSIVAMQRRTKKKHSHTFSIHSSKYTEECWFRDGVKRLTTVLEEEMWIHHNNSARLPFYRFINPFIHVYAEECEKFEISTNLLVNALSRSRWRFRIQWIVVKWWWCKNEWEGNKKSTHIHHPTEMFW